jgi:hypothetical protein
MEDKTGKDPKALPDEALDEAAGGITFGGTLQGEASYPGFGGGVNKAGITDGTSNAGYVGGTRVAVGDVNNDGAALKIADGSVKKGG